MIQSRCGILCEKCHYKEELGCNSCVNINKPFWGESCPVKSCCENKNLAHCGQRDIFPCELLMQFAYDKEQGDEGKRIEQCRRWQS